MKIKILLKINKSSLLTKEEINQKYGKITFAYNKKENDKYQVIMISDLNIAYMQNKKNQEEQEKLYRKNAEKEDLCLSIYTKCIERKIGAFDNSQDIDALKIIAKNCGVDDIDIAKKYFFVGKDLFEEKRKEDEEKKLKNIRKKEYEQYEENKRKAQIRGKQKYITKLEKKISSNEALLQLGEQVNNTAKVYSNYQAQKQDWAIAGGLASGMAGTGAGIATALDVQQKNAKAEVEAAEIRNNAKNTLKNNMTQMIEISGDLAEQRLKLEKIQNKLIDEEDIYKKFDLLEFSNWKFELLESKNIKVSGSVYVKNKVKIINADAILDGSLKIDVINKEKKIIGSGCYCAPGFEDVELKNVGFNELYSFSVVCVVSDYDYIKEDDEYTCKVSPINMWTIEK